MAFPSGWGRKCELVIQHSQVSADCTDFPVLVTKDTLPSEIFDADGSYPALNGGGDIRFSSDSAGNTQLPCEIEQFVTDNDPANGKAAVWTKRTLSSAANTSVWIWYNKTGESQPVETDTYGKHAVWDSNFEMVQHMNQDPSGSAPQMIDSTSNSNDGTSAGSMTSADLVDGQIGKGIDLEGTDDEITIGTINQNVTTGAISLWVKPSSLPSGEHFLYSQYFDRFYIKTDGSTLMIRLGDGAFVTVKTISTGTWYHISLVWNSGTYYAYLNKVQEATGSITGLTDGSGPGYIGGHAGGYHSGGIFDEFRISTTNRSSGWIETEYNNQKDPATFIIEGTPETPGGGITLTISELAGSGALDNIALTQKHVLAIQALDSAGLLDNITLELSTILVVAEALSSGALDNITLTQKHLLAVDALLSSGLLDNVTLTQKHVLAIQELLSSGVLDNVTLTQKHIIAIQELTSSGALDNITLSISTLLIIADLLTEGSLDNITLTQKHFLAIQELLSSGALDNIDLIQKYTLAVQELLSIGTIDSIDLVFATLLVVAEMLSAGLLDNSELTQNHILTVDEVLGQGTINTVGLTQANILTIQELLSSGVIDEINFGIASGIICITLTQACEYNMPLTQSIEYNMLLIQTGGGVCG